MCLESQLQEDDCASGSHGCWSSTQGGHSFSACKDTFRGFVCQCPAGAALPGSHELPAYSVYQNA